MVALDGEGDPRSGLTPHALAVVEALLAAPVAWRSPAHLRAASGLDEAATFCGLEDLEAVGLICHWETEAELTVTLTPIGAARLAVRLIEVGPDELPRWAQLEAPDPPPLKAKGVFRDYRALDLVVSPDPGPEESLDESESVAPADLAPRLAPHDPDPDAPLPARLGNLSRIRSDGPAPGEPCRACGSAVRRADCPYCPGDDAVPAKARRNNRPRAARRSAAAKADRKARLKARFS